MANPDHLAKLKEGVQPWNQWRYANRIPPDPSSVDSLEVFFHSKNLRYPELSGANLSGWKLGNADLSNANLSGADLSHAFLIRASLTSANLSDANLRSADLGEATLDSANLSGANLSEANLTNAILDDANLTNAILAGAIFLGAQMSGATALNANFSNAMLFRAVLDRANLSEANLSSAKLDEASLGSANLSGANLSRANLSRVDLHAANLSRTDFTGADLTGASLVEANLKGAILSECRIYGVSVWDAGLNDAIQHNLVITPKDQPAIQVDNLEVAQFVYLLLNNQKIRDVIDTVAKKAVLILGRFTPQRKAVLDAIRDALRQNGYLPILFDFDKPANRDLQETIVTLAGISCFIIADISDPRSIPQELVSIVPDFPSVPVQPLLQTGYEQWAMYDHIKRFKDWVLPLYNYQDQSTLLAEFQEKVIAPAKAKAKELGAGA
jgi:uncharacterized protein YjbI with pentapeptide repeats